MAVHDSQARGAAAFELLLRQLQKIKKQTPVTAPGPVSHPTEDHADGSLNC